MPWPLALLLCAALAPALAVRNRYDDAPGSLQERVAELAATRLGLLSGSLEHRKSLSVHVNRLFALEFGRKVKDSGGVPRGVRYALASCGSMGRLEMAPLSDIDYFVLVEDAGEDVKEFFLGVAGEIRDVFHPMRDYRLPICPFTAPDRFSQLIGVPEDMASLQLDSDLEGHVANALVDSHLASGDEGLFRDFVAGWFRVAKGEKLLGPGTDLALKELRRSHHLSSEFVDTKVFIKAIEVPVISIFLCLLFREPALPSPLPVHIEDRLQWLADREVLPGAMAHALGDAYQFFFALRVQVHNTKNFEFNFVNSELLSDAVRGLVRKLEGMVACFDREAAAFASWVQEEGSAEANPLSGECLQHLEGSTITRAPVIAFPDAASPEWASAHGTVVNTDVDEARCS